MFWSRDLAFLSFLSSVTLLFIYFILPSARQYLRFCFNHFGFNFSLNYQISVKAQRCRVQTLRQVKTLTIYLVPELSSSSIIRGQNPTSTYTRDVRSKAFSCTACNKRFPSNGLLKQHFSSKIHQYVVKENGLPDPALHYATRSKLTNQFF